MNKHLWEVKHPYYCTLNNYFASGHDQPLTQFDSFEDCLDEWGDSDFDYNLLFRWDWIERDEDGEPNYSGDDNEKNGELRLFWMLQRKGCYSFSTVKVCRNDEQKVIEFLKPRLEHLMSLWSPLIETSK